MATFNGYLKLPAGISYFAVFLLIIGIAHRNCIWQNSEDVLSRRSGNNMPTWNQATSTFYRIWFCFNSIYVYSMYIYIYISIHIDFIQCVHIHIYVILFICYTYVILYCTYLFFMMYIYIQLYIIWYIHVLLHIYSYRYFPDQPSLRAGCFPDFAPALVTSLWQMRTMLLECSSTQLGHFGGFYVL